jgi:diaminohydroxyphosphoribosylaminopyrimidine deaminase/5-amino-6-(5-phosphoribosylamino)uracil reductase
MKRALQLARKGLGRVAPNPMVGAVLAYDEKIIGEGYHQQYGGPHAEVHAIQSVSETERLRECTLYVTLEPCAHHGKTPPCADLIISMGIPRVVIGQLDPNPLVAGKGMEKLKKAGITVELSCLENECRQLNRRFLTFFENKRPYIILKWAQSQNKKISGAMGKRINISHELSRQLTHKWRSEEQAILVGKNTIRHDNPVLNTRHWQGHDPIRVILDRNLSLNHSFHVFRGPQPTLLLNTKKEENTGSHLDYVYYDGSIDGLLTALFNRQIQSVLVEGGKETLNAFVKADLWDEIRVFTASTRISEGVSAPDIPLNAVEYAREAIMQDELIMYNHPSSLHS